MSATPVRCLTFSCRHSFSRWDFANLWFSLGISEEAKQTRAGCCDFVLIMNSKALKWHSQGNKEKWGYMVLMWKGGFEDGGDTSLKWEMDE